MTHVQMKEQLMERVEMLSDERLEELLSFATFLAQYKIFADKHNENNLDVQAAKYASVDDPILRLAGFVEHGSLAQNLDEELYGEESLR